MADADRVPLRQAAPPDAAGQRRGAPPESGTSRASTWRMALARAMAAAPPDGWRGEWRTAAEIVALCGFVVVQPLLGVVGSSPDFFLFHGVAGAEIFWLVAALVVVPPVVLWSVGVLSRLAGPRVRRGVHVATVAVLLTLLVIQIGKHLTGVRGPGLAILAALAAAALMVVYLRYDAAKQLLRFAAAGPLVFGLLFAFASPASAVVFPDDSPASGGETRVIGPNPPIVMVLFDELPLTSLLDSDGSIDAERFPSFARVAAGSTWYRNATTVAGWTPYAMPAMLSGEWPAEHVAPHYSEYPDNLFTLLTDVYDVELSESISQLCPPWQCGDLAAEARRGMPAVFSDTVQLFTELLSPYEPERDPEGDFVEPTIADRLGQAAAAAELGPEFRFDQAGVNQPARFRHFLDRLESPSQAHERPTLHFLHLLLPHNPYRYLPSGIQYGSVPGLPVEGGWWGHLTLHRLELQLEYTDRLLGEILDALERTGRYDESLLVVTSDHGVSLDPAAGRPRDGLRTVPWRELGPDDQGAAESAWVPLFIKEPGQTEPVVDDGNWQHVDLLPTLADLAGVEVPWQVDGISWQRERREGSDKVYFSELSDRRVLDGAGLFPRILADPDAFPPLPPPPPMPELTGVRVGGRTGPDGPGGAALADPGAFDDVQPATGTVPALIHGTVPAEVGADTPLAIAVNGRVGAVVPAIEGDGEALRFAGLVEDPSLFTEGANTVEIFMVVNGSELRRLSLG